MVRSAMVSLTKRLEISGAEWAMTDLATTSGRSRSLPSAARDRAGCVQVPLNRFTGHCRSVLLLCKGLLTVLEVAIPELNPYACS